MNDSEKVVRSVFRAYELGDRQLIENILAEDFSFSAPPDPHLDKTGYFERCWPFSAHHLCFTLEEIFVRENTVMVLYTCTRNNGPDIRNTELFQLRDGKIISVTVFFGPEIQ